MRDEICTYVGCCFAKTNIGALFFSQADLVEESLFPPLRDFQKKTETSSGHKLEFQ